MECDICKEPTCMGITISFNLCFEHIEEIRVFELKMLKERHKKITQE